MKNYHLCSINKEEKITSRNSFEITSGKKKKMKNNHFWSTKIGKKSLQQKVFKTPPMKNNEK